MCFWASRWLNDKESACQIGEPATAGSIPGSEDPLEYENDNLFQYSA